MESFDRALKSFTERQEANAKHIISSNEMTKILEECLTKELAYFPVKIHIDDELTNSVIIEFANGDAFEIRVWKTKKG